MSSKIVFATLLNTLRSSSDIAFFTASSGAVSALAVSYAPSKAHGAEVGARPVAHVAVEEGLGVEEGAGVAGPLIGGHFPLARPPEAAPLAHHLVRRVVQAALPHTHTHAG